MGTVLAGPNPPKTRAPRSYEALKNSIQFAGVISPIIVSQAGSIIDGRERHRATGELGVACPQISRRSSNWVAEERIARRSNERDMNIRAEIIRLAGVHDDNGIGLFTEEAIAQACGVGLPYVISIVENLVSSLGGFPLRRWRDEETVVDSLVRPPDPGPELHQVLAHIPPVSQEAYSELLGDMVANGQRAPILIDQEGLLVDGRARWKACQELGITPVTQVIEENGWEASLAANRPRFPEISDRVVIVSTLPYRKSPSVPGDQRPPTVGRAAELFDVPDHYARAFRALSSRPGTEGFQQAVLDGKIRIYTAARTVRAIPPELWPATLERMLDEASRGLEPSLPVRPEDTPEMRTKAAADSGIVRRRRGRVNMAAVEQAINSLAALKSILEDAEILDPSITREQAAEALRSLSTDRRQIGRLMNLLKERKEST